METITEILKEYAYLFGYKPSETPLFEEADVFLTKAGDQVIEKLITFDLKGKKMALRPEFTASLAQKVAEEYDLPQRFQFSGPIFHQVNNAQKKDYKQQSFGVELVGSDGELADAEVIALAALSLERLGIKDYQIIVGHVGLTRALLEDFNLTKRLFRYILSHRQRINIDQAKFLQEIVEDFDFKPEQKEVISHQAETTSQHMLHSMLKRTNMTLGSRTPDDIVRRLGEKYHASAAYENVVDAVQFLGEWSKISSSVSDVEQLLKSHIRGNEAQEILSSWLLTLKYLEAFGINKNKIIIEPDLARTWDYYTGIVFEIRIDDIYIGGGGRYNDLVRLFNGTKNVPAIGFAVDMDALNTFTQQTATEDKVFQIISAQRNSDKDLIRWANELRLQNIAIEVTENIHSKAEVITIDNNSAIYDGEQFSIEHVDNLIAKLTG